MEVVNSRESLSVKAEIAKATRMLDDVQRKQIPFATRMAMNKVVATAVTDLQAAMTKTFDRPTPYTLKAFYYKKTKPRDLTVFVGAREWAGKSGNPAWKYLFPEVFGGPRRKKGFELKMGSVAGNQYVLPTPYTPLDQYGNIQPGFLTQVMSRLSLLEDKPGAKQNITAKKSAALWRKKATVHHSGHISEYFVVYDKYGNRRPIGIYKLVSKGVVREVLTFTPNVPSYRANFPFFHVVEGTFQKDFPSEFEAALQRALQTAK